ncbi:superoxide dismutase [Bacillus sp. HMF5848]|uniref:superoxide dismutase n=1 Tax=Bacillus sp. HMF5848 TaxID=2495421 RepID=UPI000F76B5A7|nr:superoxide dismutase [Bacillus sp. HMF5848]RSK27499.1 superoxide dismutase [Bacillus sp. HMF5848]
MDRQLTYEQYVKDVQSWVQQVEKAVTEDARSSTLSSIIQEISTLTNKSATQDTVRQLDVCVRQLQSAIENRSDRQRVPIGQHTLPPLPYNYNALEPYIDEEIMRLHHTKHHQSYVDGLNKAELKMQQSRKTGDYDLLKHWEREAAFHGSGHYLHTLFWDVMTPTGGGMPKGKLLKQIDMDFGSFDDFKAHFSKAAEQAEGVGWAILVWAPRAQRLEILQTEKQQLFTQWDTIPILPLDVWEHAYYLQYKTDRKSYVKNWWNLINWPFVEERFEEASKLRWQPY